MFCMYEKEIRHRIYIKFCRLLDVTDNYMCRFSDYLLKDLGSAEGLNCVLPH